MFTYNSSREKFWLALYARQDLVKIVNLKTLITFEIMIRSSSNFGKMLFTVCSIRKNLRRGCISISKYNKFSDQYLDEAESPSSEAARWRGRVYGAGFWVEGFWVVPRLSAAKLLVHHVYKASHCFTEHIGMWVICGICGYLVSKFVHFQWVISRLFVVQFLGKRFLCHLLFIL